MSYRGIQLLLCLVLACAHLSCGGKFESKPLSYIKYRLYEVILESNLNENIDLSEKLLSLQKESDSIIFLDDVVLPGKPGHVVVAPHKAVDFEIALMSMGLHWDLLSDNYKYYVAGDAKQVNSLYNTYDWVSYYKLNSTYDFLNRLQKNNAGVVTNFVIGKSFEGRPIYAVNVLRVDKSKQRRSASKPDPDVSDGPRAAAGIRQLQRYLATTVYSITKKPKIRPSIFIEAGMHGNTWITSAVATYIINELVYSEEPAISMVAKRYNWVILPHANPDGYVHTDTSDLLWSRTRGKHGHCIGVDPNRNFDVNWQYSNETHAKCNKNYRGPHPFSEVETKALADTLLAARGTIQLYISLHFGERIAATVGRNPINGQPASEAYYHSGSSVAWAYSKAGIKNAFNFNVGSNSGTGKFLVSGTQVAEGGIVDIAKDALYAIVALADKLVPSDVEDTLFRYLM